MTLHSITRKVARAAPRVGRGGKRGKTSGRGMKGQKARAGNSMRPELRDTIKRYPKRRGHGKNRVRTVISGRGGASVSLGAIDAAFQNNDTVTPQTLTAVGLVSAREARAGRVKILGTGTLKTAVNVSGCSTSRSARVCVEAAGGSVVAQV